MAQPSFVSQDVYLLPGRSATTFFGEVRVTAADGGKRSNPPASTNWCRVGRTIGGFACACRFLVLATVDAQGRADLSPKGDPAGAMVYLEGGTLWFADRPGNTRIERSKPTQRTHETSWVASP